MRTKLAFALHVVNVSKGEAEEMSQKAAKAKRKMEALINPIDSGESGSPLMLTKGNQAFQDQIFRTTPDKFKFNNRREMGHPVVNDKIDTKQDDTLAHERAWILPTSFCIDCGKTDIVPKRGPTGEQRLNTGVIVIDQERPDIGCKPGDVIMHFTCHDCIDTENWRNPNIIHIPTGVHYETAHERRDRQAIEWCQAAWARGDSPITHKAKR